MKYLIYPGILATGLALVLWTNGAVAHGEEEKSSTRITLKASNPVLIRRITGPVSNSINGVPAEPVDSFDWEGVSVTSIRGHAKLVIDPVNNTGKITAEWKDEYGRWTYKQKTFAPPMHATGVRIGPSVNTVVPVEGDPVAVNVYLHGDTGVGGPVTPTFFALLATWGPAKITLNGEDFNNPFSGPTGLLWAGHTILSEEFRGSDGVVRTTDGDVFNPSQSSEGLVYPNKINFNLAFHDTPRPEMTTNMPPPHSFFYRISFKDVKVNIRYK